MSLRSAICRGKGIIPVRIKNLTKIAFLSVKTLWATVRPIYLVSLMVMVKWETSVLISQPRNCCISWKLKLREGAHYRFLYSLLISCTSLHFTSLHHSSSAGSLVAFDSYEMNKVYTHAFEKMNNALHVSSIDDTLSGTTAISITLRGDTLYGMRINKLSKNICTLI